MCASVVAPACASHLGPLARPAPLRARARDRDQGAALLVRSPGVAPLGLVCYTVAMRVCTQFCFVVLVLIFCAPLLASEDILDAALKPYQSADVIQIKTNKTIQTPWKTKGEKSTGRLYLSKGRFRWETDAPDKEWTIFDGRTLWSIRFASRDFPGKNHVLKMKLAMKERKKFFYLRMLDSETLHSDFAIGETIENKSYSLSPKKGGAADLGFRDVEIGIQNGYVSRLTYRDDVDNQTTIEMQKPEKKKTRFSYKPNPKTDEVEEK